ncbi:MAG: class I SAM-dependent methyltransferase [Pseudomonadota bacterium]|nr:class I SAM-dependent methyltransferase [Pseudomonadota bacterium]
MISAPPENVYATSKKIKFIQKWIRMHSEKLERKIRVLDFGCGNGEELARFIIGSQIDYVGVDIHEPSLNHARSELGGDNAVFASQIPKDQTFDVIVLSEVLEHLDDPVAVLNELVTSLNDDGIVVGSVPNGYGLTEIEKYIDAKLKIYPALRWVKRTISGRAAGDASVVKIPYNYESGHVQFYTKFSLRRVVRAAGLEIKDFQNGSFMGADLSGATIFTWKKLIAINTWVADFLPFWAAATWHFVLCKKI